MTSAEVVINCPDPFKQPFPLTQPKQLVLRRNLQGAASTRDDDLYGQRWWRGGPEIPWKPPWWSLNDCFFLQVIKWGRKITIGWDDIFKNIHDCSWYLSSTCRNWVCILIIWGGRREKQKHILPLNWGWNPTDRLGWPSTFHGQYYDHPKTSITRKQCVYIYIYIYLQIGSWYQIELVWYIIFVETRDSHQQGNQHPKSHGSLPDHHITLSVPHLTRGLQMLQACKTRLGRKQLCRWVVGWNLCCLQQTWMMNQIFTWEIVA